MSGSDWPVCVLAGLYQQQFDALRGCLSSLSDAERPQIYCGTAMRFSQIVSCRPIP